MREPFGVVVDPEGVVGDLNGVGILNGFKELGVGDLNVGSR